MENLLIKVAEQVPNLGILGFIVWIFLMHLARRDEAIRQLHVEHLEERRVNREVIRENTESNKELLRALAKLNSK